MNHEGHRSTLGVEAATAEEFLRLLKEREEAEGPSRGSRDATRRAVFVAQVVDRRSSGYGYPAVRRSVVAAFAYGRDLVSYKRTTSSAVELPEITKKTAERQQKVYEEVRAEVERGLECMGVDLSVYEGALRHPRSPARTDGFGANAVDTQYVLAISHGEICGSVLPRRPDAAGPGPGGVPTVRRRATSRYGTQSGRNRQWQQ